MRGMPRLRDEDRQALLDLKRTAEARGPITEAMRVDAKEGRAVPPGLDPRHVCKRPMFAAVYSVEEHDNTDGTPGVHRHLSVSIPSCEPPPAALVDELARVLGFTRHRSDVLPSPEPGVGWRITHVFEVIR